MIKKFFVFLTGLFLVASLSVAQGTVDEQTVSESLNEASTTAEPVAYINYVEGKALFVDFQEVELNVILQQGDEINTENGRIEVLLKGGGVIRLDYNTRVVFAALTEKSVMLEIWGGNVYVKKGELEVGIKSVSRSLNLTQAEWYFAEPEKSFEKWNEERDEELTPRDEYLPEELSRYGYTLNRYGSWRHYSPYGCIWIPRVGLDWQPYLYGRWVWYPIIGWTWVSYEPFGWCVFHYGRWQWCVELGWYWIPIRYWGPHWVFFYNYGDYYYWTPRWYDRHYYNRYWHRYYADASSHAWTKIHKSQLKSRDISRSVISKSELQQTPHINQNQLRTSISNSDITMTTRRSISKSLTRTPKQAEHKIYSPDSRIFIQRKNPESISSRNSRIISPRTNTLSPSFSPRSNTQLRPSPRISDRRSFLSPSTSRSFSRPQISRSPFSSRSIQKKIRKK